MSTHYALACAIIDNPYDVAVCGAYADFLAESGRLEEEMLVRAWMGAICAPAGYEFMQKPNKDTYDYLLSQQSKWLSSKWGEGLDEPFQSWSNYTSHLNFGQWISLSSLPLSKDFPKKSEVVEAFPAALYRISPYADNPPNSRSYCYKETYEFFKDNCRSPALDAPTRYIRRLDLNGWACDPIADLFIAGHNLVSLDELHLYSLHLSSSKCSALLDTFPGLRKLKVSGAKPGHLRAIIQSGIAPSLIELKYFLNGMQGIPAEECRLLAEANSLANLRALRTDRLRSISGAMALLGITQWGEVNPHYALHKLKTVDLGINTDYHQEINLINAFTACLQRHPEHLPELEHMNNIRIEKDANGQRHVFNGDKEINAPEKLPPQRGGRQR